MSYIVGDKVWIAENKYTEKTRECPVCSGAKAVVVILGNGDRYAVTCEYCACGYEGPRGVVVEREWECKPEQVTITEVKLHQTVEGETFEYSSGYRGITDRIFDTEEEAAKKCRELIEAHVKDEEDRAYGSRKRAMRNATWTVGYHIREANKARKEMERHEARAKKLKE